MQTLVTSSSPYPASEAVDWHWQLRHAVRSWDELGRVLRLGPEELSARDHGLPSLPLLITPYYLSLCDPQDPACPLRRQVVPTRYEWIASSGDVADPLSEVEHEVAPDLVQRYPDRALLLVTTRCATYCRFCTRRRIVGRSCQVGRAERLEAAIAYLREHPEIRDLILSGGDPLILPTHRLVRLLGRLRTIPSLETIRLATRTPAVLPQRITEELTGALRPYHPLWVMTHFNHARELTPLAIGACMRLADAGFPLMNQTVLLAGVNDRAESLAALFRGLVRARVRPYYLLQTDPVSGTGHLRTPLRRGIELMGELQGRLSGIAIPKFVLDSPGGDGKVPLCPDYLVSRSPGRARVLTPRGTEIDYLDPS